MSRAVAGTGVYVEGSMVTCHIPEPMPCLLYTSDAADDWLVV